MDACTKNELVTRAADQEAPEWRIARHGSLHLNKEKVQKRETDQPAHLQVYIHLCEARAPERGARREAAKQYRKKRGEEKRGEKRRKGQERAP